MSSSQQRPPVITPSRRKSDSRVNYERIFHFVKTPFMDFCIVYHKNFCVMLLDSVLMMLCVNTVLAVGIMFMDFFMQILR